MSWPQVGHLIHATRPRRAVDSASDRIRGGKSKTGSFKISQTSTATCWFRLHPFNFTTRSMMKVCSTASHTFVPRLPSMRLKRSSLQQQFWSVTSVVPLDVPPRNSRTQREGAANVCWKFFVLRPGGLCSDHPAHDEKLYSQLRIGTGNAICLP